MPHRYGDGKMLTEHKGDHNLFSVVVKFNPDCQGMPTDFPSTGWHTRHTTSEIAEFSFDRDGMLHLRQAGSDFDFVSPDASGTLLLYRPGTTSALNNEAFVTFHNGHLTDVSLSKSMALPGFVFSPTWEIAGARVNGLNQAYQDNNVEASISLIQDAAIDPGIKGASRSSEFMLGLALCDPERLSGAAPITAWKSLTQAQLRALTSWFAGSLAEASKLTKR
jgi:hypothetical protein